MLTGFAHETGNHCGSTSLRDVSDFNEWGLSEPLCFGIGAGLGFSYIEREDSPTRQFVGRSPWLETGFYDHLGITFEERDGQPFDDAWTDIRTHLDAGRPVLLFVDIYYLEYFDSDVHFSPHVVVAVGHEDDTVLLADSEFDDVQRLPLDQLADSLDSDHGFFGPIRNHWLAPTGEEPTRPVANAIHDGIALTTKTMLEPESFSFSDASTSTGTHGLAGMRAFGRDLPDWQALPDATWCTRFAYQNVEKRGTGGGAFRGLFAPFLDEAAERTDLVTAELAAEAHEIASDWSDIGQSLKRAGLADEEDEAKAAYEEAGEQVLAVADREEELYRTLRDRL
ncbi:BtrH N-terminal domain-containing protein [Haloarchaeobius amylolyticus]|uniref:BtrH N-terminal domain-containing protein n=1 Tax=Haloarchaeobius amylolyticus TaxID=1198296 RepID=UPI0022705D7F|nr:BtrH N-terminal domain-containing protein [Haloarchaeobius amylolyticus]